MGRANDSGRRHTRIRYGYIAYTVPNRKTAIPVCQNDKDRTKGADRLFDINDGE